MHVEEFSQVSRCTCVCVCVKYQSVCIAQYVSTWWGGQGEPLMMGKFYSTLVWMITHINFTAFSCYDSVAEHMTRVIWPISFIKEWSVVTNQYRVLQRTEKAWQMNLYRVILSVLDPRKCEYLKDYSLDFEHAYMTTYLASWKACRY